MAPALVACVRCGGSLLPDWDTDGDGELRCILCGRTVGQAVPVVISQAPAIGLRYCTTCRGHTALEPEGPVRTRTASPRGVPRIVAWQRYRCPVCNTRTSRMTKRPERTAA